MAPFLEANAGKLVAATGSQCGFCRFATGDDFLATLDFGFEKRWTAMAIFALYTVFNVGLAYFFVCDGRPRVARFARACWRQLSGKAAIALE